MFTEFILWEACRIHLQPFYICFKYLDELTQNAIYLDVPFTRENYYLLDRRNVCPNKFVVTVIRRVCEIF